MDSNGAEDARNADADEMCGNWVVISYMLRSDHAWDSAWCLWRNHYSSINANVGGAPCASESIWLASNHSILRGHPAPWRMQQSITAGIYSEFGRVDHLTRAPGRPTLPSRSRFAVNFEGIDDRRSAILNVVLGQ